MKKFRNILCITMVLTIILNLNIMVFAQTYELNEYQENFNIIKTNNGNIFYQKDNLRAITIVTNDNNNLIEVDIMNVDNPGVVYQLFISDYKKNFNINSNEFWNSIIKTADNRISDAKIIKIDVKDVTFDKPIDVTDSKSSAGADLKADLVSLLGNEYEGETKFSKVYYSPTYAGISIYERMDFRIQNSGYKTWNTSDILTIGAFITGVLSIATTNPLIAALALVFDVAGNASSIISSSGRINKYNCVANIARYATVNNSDYVYNITDKIISYNGYEDNDLNSTGRAAVDSSSKYTYYSDSYSYYTNYNLQADDAYDMFLNIGQML